MKLKSPSSCEIRMTETKGWGVFAINFIPKDSIIEECYILTIPQDSIQHNLDLFVDYRYNWPQGLEWKEQVLPLGFGLVYNHSESPNATWQDHPKYERVFQYIAIKDIYPNEEICTYYGDGQYWSEGRTHTNIV